MNDFNKYRRKVNKTIVSGSMESSTTKHYRHITLSKGLSKYGPWGYLILGMLLCGGALLVCVLWGNIFNQQSYFLISVKHKTLISLILTLNVHESFPNNYFYQLATDNDE